MERGREKRSGGREGSREKMYLSPFTDLEALRYLADSGGKSRASRDKSQKENLLLVGERVERLPKPLYSLVILTNAISVSEGKPPWDVVHGYRTMK